jgi:hypothetical protein
MRIGRAKRGMRAHHDLVSRNAISVPPDIAQCGTTLRSL